MKNRKSKMTEIDGKMQKIASTTEKEFAGME